MKNKLISISLVNALGATVYVALVSYVIQNGERFFGQMNDLIGPMSFLLLFVLSAAIMVVLVFGKPVMLYLDGSKKESINLLFYTIGWLFLLTLIALLAQIF